MLPHTEREFAVAAHYTFMRDAIQALEPLIMLSRVTLHLKDPDLARSAGKRPIQRPQNFNLETISIY